MPRRSMDTMPLMPEAPLRRGPIATVAPRAPIDKTYSYFVPDELAGRVAPGVRVMVRLGRREKPQPAFCIAVSEGEWDSTLKPIDEVLDVSPLLSARLLELGEWIARYYACPLGHTLQAMVPAGARQQSGTRVVRFARATSSDVSGLRPRQAIVIKTLIERGEPMPAEELCVAVGCGAGVLRTLAAAGRIEFEERRESRPAEFPSAEPHEPTFQLNADQTAAIARMTDAVRAAAFQVMVLFGVTGSGKTECYVRAIRAAIAAGKQAIVLVPEIALTTQTVQRLARRFERVAVLHSGLTDAKRSRIWAAIAEGCVPVVIGTRSAVFAPCPNLGLIVVDEEPESSFKNQAAPRYHTRDVAIKRAQLESIPVVLGSAAPSLETWFNVGRLPHYHLLRLPKRVGGLPMPRVDLVDMREEHRARKGIHLLSRAMEEQLQGILSRGEQAVLLLNRRGYASFLFCPRCNTPIVCPNCSVHMVFHAASDAALCHYCHERLVLPTRCSMADCGGTLVRFGIGTQRVEQEVMEKFPRARLARLDRDAMIRPEDYVRVLGDFEARRLDLLIGTQMVAKGLDFPFVSFVGVISADTALSLPDFRATERTFQLVLQVAGRSGRSDVGGRVLVQTFASDVTAIRRAVHHDYEGFAVEELENRRRVGLPPHTRLVRIVLADARLSRLQNEAAGLAESIGAVLQKHGLAGDVFPIQPSPIPRLRNKYRYDVLIRFPTAAEMLRGLDLFRAEGVFRAGSTSLIVDVDPVALQ